MDCAYANGQHHRRAGTGWKHAPWSLIRCRQTVCVVDNEHANSAFRVAAVKRNGSFSAKDTEVRTIRGSAGYRSNRPKERSSPWSRPTNGFRNRSSIGENGSPRLDLANFTRGRLSLWIPSKRDQPHRVATRFFRCSKPLWPVHSEYGRTARGFDPR